MPPLRFCPSEREVPASGAQFLRLRFPTHMLSEPNPPSRVSALRNAGAHKPCARPSSGEPGFPSRNFHRTQPRCLPPQPLPRGIWGDPENQPPLEVLLGPSCLLHWRERACITRPLIFSGNLTWGPERTRLCLHVRTGIQTDSDRQRSGASGRPRQLMTEQNHFQRELRQWFWTFPSTNVMLSSEISRCG